MRRELRPRATSSLAIAPALVTDLTSAVVVGLEARPFRQLVKDEGIPHARIGQRVIAKVEDVVSAVERLANRQAGEPATNDVERPEDDDAPATTADAILARIGRVRTGGGDRAPVPPASDVLAATGRRR